MQLLFKSGYYFSQQTNLCSCYSRVATIRERRLIEQYSSAKGRNCSHSSWILTYVLSICNKDLLRCSTSPSPCGWYAEGCDLLIPNACKVCAAEHFWTCILDLSAGLVVDHRWNKVSQAQKKLSLLFGLEAGWHVPIWQSSPAYKEVVVVVWREWYLQDVDSKHLPGASNWGITRGAHCGLVCLAC